MAKKKKVAKKKKADPKKFGYGPMSKAAKKKFDAHLMTETTTGPMFMLGGKKPYSGMVVVTLIQKPDNTYRVQYEMTDQFKTLLEDAGYKLAVDGRKAKPKPRGMRVVR